ncbi:MAG: replication factor C large subunit [Candidatus Pacearchaeota archaeon]
MTWVEKYRPTRFEDIRGQDEALQKIKKFVGEFNLGKLTKTKKKAMILHGPPGVGKTTIAHVIAKETNSEIFELNASDLRNKSRLDEVLKPAIQQQSLIKKSKLILVDEADGISGYTDYGGISELIKIIEDTTYPVIITANDIWDKKLAPLRKKAELVQLKGLDYRTTKEIMIDILRKENNFIKNEILTKLAINAKGDLRAAINDLQTEAADLNQDPQSEYKSERNKESDIFNVLRTVLKGKPGKETLNLFDSVKMNLDEIMLWIEKNIPLEYQGRELARAIDLISKADVFRGRIYKQQYWRFLVYQNIFLSYGVSASKDQNKNAPMTFTSYKKPDRILKIWMSNQKNAKKKSIAKKYSRYVHVGEKRALREFSMIKNFLKNPQVQKEIRLDQDEIEYLKAIQ